VASHLALAAAPSDLLPYAVHQAEAIARHLAGTGRSAADVDVVLIGHSVGAYLAYLIVARRLLPVTRVFMLCPFLARPSLSGRLILRLVTSRRLFAALLRGWRLVPAQVQRWLIALGGAGGHGEWVQGALASSRPRNWAAMAGAEAREIATRADASYLLAEPLFRQPEGLVPVLCRRDRWAPRRWPAGAVEPVGGLGHAFVVDPRQCRLVARLVHERLAGR
jgi:alpha-beta hydrolase superfamily lysophospholipase